MTAAKFVRYSAINDKGDGDTTANQVFNICFIPDPKSLAAKHYSSKLITASDNLRFSSDSSYLLKANPHPFSLIESHVHATVSHAMLINPADNWEKFSGQIAPLVGQTQDLRITGLHFFKGAPFQRVMKATNGRISRLHHDITDRVIWAAIGLTEEYRAIQDAVHDVVAEMEQAAYCVSAKGDASMPHHTMYVERVNESNPLKTNFTIDLDWENVPEPAVIPHILAIADCGPWGQVRRYTTDPRQVKAFINSTCVPC